METIELENEVVEQQEVKKFEIGEIDLGSIGRYAGGTIPVKVHGFWSRDPIYISVNRGWESYSGKDITWHVTVNHSTGGRDSKVEIDDLTAEENFALAMLAAVELAREIRATRIPDFERAFQEHAELLEQARIKREEERKKEIEADPALGEAKAKYFLDVLKATAKVKSFAEMTMFDRADKNPYKVTAETTYSDRVTFRFQGSRYGYQDLLKKLANSSERTTLSVEKK